MSVRPDFDDFVDLYEQQTEPLTAPFASRALTLAALPTGARIIDVAAGFVPAPGLPSLTRLRAALGDRHQMLVPVEAHGQVVGVLYIDRAPSRPVFPENTQEGLLHFARLAGLALEQSGPRR